MQEMQIVEAEIWNCQDRSREEGGGGGVCSFS